MSTFWSDLAIRAGKGLGRRSHGSHEQVERGLAQRNLELGHHVIPRIGPIGLVLGSQGASLPQTAERKSRLRWAGTVLTVAPAQPTPLDCRRTADTVVEPPMRMRNTALSRSRRARH